MAKIVPFRGLRYNPSRVEINNATAPPYDVIGEEGRELLYDRHENNIVRLIKGKDLPDDGPDENKYTRAGRCLDDWIADGVLIRDERPCVYV